MGVPHLPRLAAALAVGVMFGGVIMLTALTHIIRGGVAVVRPMRNVQTLELADVARELLELVGRKPQAIDPFAKMAEPFLARDGKG